MVKEMDSVERSGKTHSESRVFCIFIAITACQSAS